MQDGHSNASVTLTPTQQRYNHIEKEMLAIVHQCERFHHYLFGKHFVIETDHRPLLGIVKKQLEDLSPRLQRMVLRLLRYNCEIKYVPGKKLQLADALSRSTSNEQINTEYLDTNLRIYSILSTSKSNEERLIEALNQDGTMNTLKQYTLNGWPEHKTLAPLDVKPY